MPSDDSRDPRVNPVPGDCFQKGEGFTTIITAMDGTLAFNFCGRLSDAPPMCPWHKPWLPAFRRWAKDAEIVAKGAENA